MSSRSERVKEALGREELFKDDFQKLMGTASGRRIIYWLLENAGVLRTTFIEVPARAQYMALAMAHDEGKKDMGYRLMAKINELCPEQYSQMMKENKDG